jgi:hypothetical protein
LRSVNPPRFIVYAQPMNRMRLIKNIALAALAVIFLWYFIIPFAHGMGWLSCSTI